MMRRKLYIDCQFFQTEVWDRGMGRYALSLIKSIYTAESGYDYKLLFSTNLPNNELAVETLEELCPDAEVVWLDLLSTKDLSLDRATLHNVRILDSYIGSHVTGNESVSRSIFMIPCLFQEPTVSVFPDSVEKCLIYYDAIPLLYYGRYKNAIDYDSYLARYKILLKADTIFTISQTISDDLSIYLGIEDTERRRVVNIDGACNDGMFDKVKKPNTLIDSKFILFPSSNDLRKNNHIAVRAFEQLKSLSRQDYKLVITSTFSEELQRELKNGSEDVIFTGNITEEELAWLYAHAEVVLFTSEYEGLGLPVLEAVKAGKKVACSNIPVFREISEDAFYFFDPLDVQEVTLALHDAISGKKWADRQALYPIIDSRYQWVRSANIVIERLNETLNHNKATYQSLDKPRIAILAPVPDGYSAIGKVVQELHEQTVQYFDVDYYFENKKGDNAVTVRPDYISSIADCYPIDSFNASLYKKYDAVIYHIGNSEYHFKTILNALHLPGIAIFHDTFLREAFGEMVRLNYIPLRRMEIEAMLDSMVNKGKTKKSEFITSVANNQLSIITHSKYAHDVLKSVTDDVDVIRAELPVVSPIRNVLAQSRKKVHIGLAGILTSNKGLDTIKSIALDKAIAKDIVLHVFGFNFSEPTVIDELSAYKNVHLMTNLSDLEYQTQLSNLDILVNYRTNYRGETSLTVLEAMRYGCNVIVNGKLGWFSELPDEAVIKVDDDTEILSSIRRLVASKDERVQVGALAQEYIRKIHKPQKYIESIASVVAHKRDTRQQKIKTALLSSSKIQEVLRKIENSKE